MTISTFTRGEKNYELSNHLGNVLVTITDKKIRYSASIDDYYGADAVSAIDYFPFGMTIPGRSYISNGYRYGFNGKEKDKEMSSLTAYDYGFRIYNPTIAKFLTVDPLSGGYPMLTPYQYASNRPIDGIDLDGSEYLNYGTALFKFVGGMSKEYVFKSSDALVMNVDKFNVYANIPGSPLNTVKVNPYNEPPTTNVGESGTTVDWEKEQIAKPNKTAMFGEFLRQMRDYNRLTVSKGSSASYANPYGDATQMSKGASILNALFEVYNIYQMYSVGNYMERHSEELKETYQSAAAFDNATNVVASSLKHGGLPNFFNSQTAKTDLVNWIIDGTTSDPDRFSDYNQGIAAWGTALINNFNSAIGGSLFNPIVVHIHNGSTAQDKDNTRIRRVFIIPAFFLNEDVQRAYNKTNGMKPKSDENNVSNE